MSKQTAASSSGVATIETVIQTGSRVQVGIGNESGSGTITITVRTPASGNAYRSIQDGTISVGSPEDVYIDGRILGVKATSDNSGDSFDLVVSG